VHRERFVFCVAFVDDPPIEEVHAAVRVSGVSLIVSHHTDRRTLVVKLAKQVHYSFAVRRVEITGRLVGQQYQRIASHRARNSNTLLLAARELAGKVLASMSHADSF
jgi:ABC-type dipeptide/oligopeptide/nickel transport system ATPase subunit